jgi:hypothetical protein
MNNNGTKITKSALSSEIEKILSDPTNESKNQSFSVDEDIAEELDETLRKCRVEITDSIPDSDPCLDIISGSMSVSICTLGNFSAIIGKAKSKKTFFLTMALATALKRDALMNTFRCSLPEGKDVVILFDTEQSRRHVHKVMFRMCRLAEVNNPDNFLCYGLRPKTPQERVELIERALQTTPKLGLVVIDGIRDLVMDINSPKESTDIVTMLMKWTEEYNIHIVTAIHQNKGDTNARGHLGTEIINKAESVISVTKDSNDPDTSIVEPEYIREREFRPFAFRVGEDGLPRIIEGWEPPKPGKKGLDPFSIAKDTHHKWLKEIFSRNPEPQYKELIEEVKYVGSQHQTRIGENKAKEFITYWKNEKMVSTTKKEGRAHPVYSLPYHSQ